MLKKIHLNKYTKVLLTYSSERLKSLVPHSNPGNNRVLESFSKIMTQLMCTFVDNFGLHCRFGYCYNYFFSSYYEIDMAMFGVRLGVCCAEVHYGTVGEAVASLVSCYKVAQKTGSKLAP